jgi:hypothetical protein
MLGHDRDDLLKAGDWLKNADADRDVVPHGLLLGRIEGAGLATALDTVNLSSEMIALPSAKELAMVNLKVLETAEEMAKSAIDLMA